MELLLVIGAIAGAVTTVVGFGGGVVLITVLATMMDPVAGLAAASVPLLVGNGHRVWMFRSSLSFPADARWVIGVLLGSIVGASVATELPQIILRVLILGTTLMLALRLARFEVRASALVPASAAVGLVGSSSGGAGLLASPILLSCGRRGTAFVALMSATGVAVSSGRLVGFGAGGSIGEDVLAAAPWVTAGIVAGNLIGKRLRFCVDDRLQSYLERALPWVCVTLAAVPFFR